MTPVFSKYMYNVYHISEIFRVENRTIIYYALNCIL